MICKSLVTLSMQQTPMNDHHHQDCLYADIAEHVNEAKSAFDGDGCVQFAIEGVYLVDAHQCTTFSC